MPAHSRGEVGLVDLGMVAKVRPCLALSASVDPQNRALATLVTHTTRERGTHFEVVVQVPSWSWSEAIELRHDFAHSSSRKTGVRAERIHRDKGIRNPAPLQVV